MEGAMCIPPNGASRYDNRNAALTQLLQWMRRPLSLIPDIGVGIAVLGMQFGDEGKGKVVSFLVQVCGIKLTVRFQGGGNAGHEITILCPDGEERKVSVHHLPEGLLFGGISAMAEGCLIHRWKIQAEIEKLTSYGFNVSPTNLMIDPHIAVSTAYEYSAGAINDDGSNDIGSTRSLIREMSMARAGKNFVSVWGCVNGYGDYALLRRELNRVRDACDDRTWVDEIDFEAELEELKRFGHFLRQHATITDVRDFINDWQRAGHDFVLVGGQGAHLDTRSQPLATSTPIWPPAGLHLENLLKVGCVKQLPTCAGPHVLPTYVPETDEVDAMRTERGDFGKTSGRKYTYYELWVDQILEAQRRLRVDMVLINKMDLDCGPVVVHDGLLVDGVQMKWWPSELEMWDPARPDQASDRITIPRRMVLPAIEGDICDVSTWDALPAGVHQRVARLDALLAPEGLQIGAIGNGPRPEDVVIRPKP